MKIRMDNETDVMLVFKMKEVIMNDIIELFKRYNIDITKMNYDRRMDLLIDLGKLCYEYRMIDFAIDDYKCKVSNELEMNTNQFCLEEDIYDKKLPPYMTIKPEDIVPSFHVDEDNIALYCKGRVIDKEEK